MRDKRVRVGQLSQGNGEQKLTFGGLRVLDLHLQLSEENVLCRVMTQVGEELERRRKGGREGKKGGRREFRESCPHSPRSSTHPPAHCRF